MTYYPALIAGGWFTYEVFIRGGGVLTFFNSGFTPFDSFAINAQSFFSTLLSWLEILAII